MEYFIQATMIVGVMISVAFIASLVIGRNDIADALWGSYPAVVAMYFWLTTDVDLVAVIVYALVIVWGVRLTLHIGSRNGKKKEDPRYAQWRRDWGAFFALRSFFQVYVLQGVLSLLVMLPVVIVTAYDTTSYVLIAAVIGALMWCVGFVFEAVGDYQLRAFIADPANKGRIMMAGLWRYTRHPNYFGEVTMWWGIFLILCGAFGIGTVLLYAIISPVTITILILGVSGIPMTEKRYEGDQAFDAYKQKTSAFFPMPPHRNPTPSTSGRPACR